MPPGDQYTGHLLQNTGVYVYVVPISSKCNAIFHVKIKFNSMGYCKEDVTPVH